MTDNTSLDILRINEKITDIERRLNSVEKYSELIYKDRELLVEIQGSVAHLKSMLVSNQEHQDNTAKDIKADIDDVQQIVESKVDETIQTIDEKTVVVKTPNHNIFKNILNLFKKKEVNLNENVRQ